MQRLIACCFICLCLVISGVSTSASSFQIWVDGKLVLFPDQQPFMDEGRTMVPVRFITERLGAMVEWEEQSRSVTITLNSTQVRLIVGDKQALKVDSGHEQLVMLDAPSTLRNGRVMVPLRFVNEALGGEVQWDSSTASVQIFSPLKNRPKPQLLAHNQRLDGDLLSRISSRPSYQVLTKWSDKSIVSTGEYSSFREPTDMSACGQYFYIRYGIEGGKDIRWASLYFSEDESFSNFFVYDFTEEALQEREELLVNKSDCAVGEGSPSWGDVKYFQIAFQSREGTEVNILPSLLASYDGVALCTLSFDDGWRDNYTNAFRIISRIDPAMPAQVGIVPSLINQAPYLTEEQIRELVAAGWEMNNHSYSHELFTELSEAAVRMEVLRAYSYIYDISPRGAYQLAVPYSEVNDDVLVIIRANTLSARYVPQQLNPIPFDRHAIAFVEVRNTTTFEEVKGWIDRAISEQRWLKLMFHRIDDPADDRYTCSTTVFEEIVQYLHEKRDFIKVVTTSEALEQAGFIVE